jgi:hypothetical protein
MRQQKSLDRCTGYFFSFAFALECIGYFLYIISGKNIQQGCAAADTSNMKYFGKG